MPIPSVDYCALPLLTLAYERNGSPLSISEATEILANHFKVMPEELVEKLKTGKDRFTTRIISASTNLRKACLVKSAGRNLLIITDRGRSVIQGKPRLIDLEFLRKFPEFKKYNPGKMRETLDEDE